MIEGRAKNFRFGGLFIFHAQDGAFWFFFDLAHAIAFPRNREEMIFITIFL